MAIVTDDIDIRDVRMFMNRGGNNDFYITLMEYNKSTLCDRKLCKVNTHIDMRISTSGSSTPHEVVLAIANLYRVMEAHGLNKHPKDEQ